MNVLKHCLLPSFVRSCHEDVIFTRKSHNWAGTAFVQGDSVGGSKLTEQTLPCNTRVHRDGGKCLSKCAQTAKQCV